VDVKGLVVKADVKSCSQAPSKFALNWRHLEIGANLEGALTVLYVPSSLDSGMGAINWSHLGIGVNPIAPILLSSKLGTYKTVKARFRPVVAGAGPSEEDAP